MRSPRRRAVTSRAACGRRTLLARSTSAVVRRPLAASRTGAASSRRKPNVWRVGESSVPMKAAHPTHAQECRERAVFPTAPARRRHKPSVKLREVSIGEISPSARTFHAQSNAIRFLPGPAPPRSPEADRTRAACSSCTTIPTRNTRPVGFATRPISKTARLP